MDKKHTVLIIDDEQDLVDMMAFQFKARGFDVATATDGQEGLDKLPEVNPSLIILDLNMPRMGGIEFYQRITGADGHPSHPVLVLTARANTEQLFRDLDIDGFMAKPFEIEDLIAEAEVIIQKHNRILPEKRRGKMSLKSVYVADNDPAALDGIALALLKAGYRVATTKTGTAALEMLAMDPPVLALIKLGLQDIPGDLVVMRAQRMAKTSQVKYVLFEPRDSRHLRSIRDNIGGKSGVMDLVEYDTPEDLVAIVDEAIQKGELEGAAPEGE